MNDAVIVGVLASSITYVVLMVTERYIHRLRKSKDRSYRWGVWVFSLLIGLYTYVTSLGR